MRNVNLITQILNVSIFTLIAFLGTINVANAQFAVTTNGGSGLAATYPSLADAITALNGAGTLTGPVVITCPTGTETAPSGGYSITNTTGTAVNTITITGNGAANSIITAANPAGTSGALNDAIFKLIGADFVTIQGFAMNENSLNTTTAAATNNMTEFGVAIFYAGASGAVANGAQNNTIQNNTITLNRTYLNTFGIYSSSRTTATAMTTTDAATTSSGSNSGNKIYSNTISNVNYGIVFIGTSIAAAFETGNDIGGSSAGTGNTITNWGGGAAPTSYSTLTGSSYCIFSNHQINDNISFNTITSAALTQSNTCGGILKNYSVTQPTGTITTTINNNTVTVTNNPTAATTGGIVGINNQGLSPFLATATMSMNNNTVQNCVLGGSTSTTNGITGITNLSLPGTMNITGNTILNNAITASTATSGSNVGISNTGAAGSLNLNTNIVRSLASTATSGQIVGITNSGAVVTALNINNNQFGNATSGFFSTSTATSGTLFGVSNSGSAATCAISITGNDIRGITYNITASAANTYFTNTATSFATFAMNNNTFTNLTINSTGAVNFLLHSGTFLSTSVSNINGNSIVTGFNKTGAGGTITIRTSNSSTPAGAVVNFQNNVFSNMTFTGGITFAGYFDNDGGAPTKSITGNTFNNNNFGTGTVTQILAAAFNGNNTTISNNTITNQTTSGGSITAISLGGSGTSTLNTVANNTITGISSTGTGGSVTALSSASAATITNINGNIINNLSSTSTTATVVGITSSTTANIFSNTINSLSNVGTTSGVTNGIMITGGTTVNVFKNKIYDLSTTGDFTTTPGVNGIVLSGGTTVNTYNNIIGLLTAPSANSTDAIRGISITSTTTSSAYNVYYNTIRNSASSSGANFGTTGIFHAASATSTTAGLNLRNNIVAFLSTPAGTGQVVAFRRSLGTSGTLANYASTSNNNLFYAGVPGANNLIYSDGTSSAQTMTAYKTGVFTAGTIAPRDASSITENPTFLSNTGSSANFLHIDPTVATQVESGASTISGITDDFDGDTRNLSTPDIGADEGVFILADLVGPNITYSTIPNTACLSAPTLTATITDASNVNTTPGTKPRLYYKRSTSNNTYAGNTSADNGWKFVEASNAASPFTFTLDYSIMFGGAPVTGEIIQYFVTAQDLAGTPNVSINIGIFSSTPATVNLTATEFPITGSINSYTLTPAGLSGTVNVGAAETYKSLTETGAAGIFNTINTLGLAGNTIINLMDPSITETGAVALNQIASSGCTPATYTLVIKPNTTAILTGSQASNALIRLNGADNVTIDGSNSGGTDRSLTITNTSTTAPSGVSIISLGTNAGAINNTIKNCNISTGVQTSTGYGIAVGGSTPGTTGADNDNVIIQNNNISACVIGIYAQGTATVSAGGNDNLNITGNIITYNSNLSGNVGINLNNSLNSVINQNNVNITTSATTGTSIAMQIAGTSGAMVNQNTVSLSTAASTAPVGISLETNFLSSSVTKNRITQVISTNTGGYGGRGITVGTGSASSNIIIANNFIAGVNGTNWSTFGGSSSMGIALGVVGNSSTLTTTSGGINLFYNSVNMTGSMGSASASALTTALYVGSGTSALDLRDNIFTNTQTATSTTQKNYAIYSAAANTAFTNINFNDYFVSNSFNAGSAVLGFLTSDRTNLAGIVSGFGGNANSLNVQPVFVSTTDLHLVPASNGALSNLGTPVSITDDIDGAPRDGSTPDMGAHEWNQPTDAVDFGNLQFVSLTNMQPCQTTDVYAQAYEPGVTEAAGQGPGLVAWVGRHTANTDPATWPESAWTTAPYFGQAGIGNNNDEYKLSYTNLPQGTFYIASRFQLNGGPFRYGATNNGFWNGTTSINETLVVALPAFTPSATPTSICVGQSTNLNVTSGNGNYSYVWNPGNLPGAAQTVSPGVTTTYTVTATDSGTTCTGTATVTVTVNPLPAVTAILAMPNPVCAGSALNLSTSANPGVIGYSSASTTFTPIASGSGTVTLASGGTATTALTSGTLDDGYWNARPLPFNFTYYGNTFSNINVQTNGIVSFTAFSTSTGYSSSPQMPNTATPNNILGVFGDQDWSFGGVISTYTSGVAPNRIFVINFNGSTGGGWYNLGSLPTALVNYQIQLFENGNKIQIHSTSIPTFSSTIRTMGIENSGGTAGVVITGRNNATWTATNDGIEFLPTFVNYSWTGPNAFTSAVQNPTIASAGPSGGVYTVQVTDNNGCTASSSTTNVTITPAPTATISGNNGPICLGSDASFNLTGTSGAVVTYNINGGGSSMVTLTGGSATVTVMGVSSAQTLNLISVNDGTCSASLSGSSTVNITTSAVVTSSADSGAGSLRAAIACIAEGGTITYDQPTTTTTILTTALTITKNLTIQGNGVVNPEITLDLPTIGGTGITVNTSKALTLQDVNIKVITSGSDVALAGDGEVIIAASTIIIE
jgi:hypothetical protein